MAERDEDGRFLPGHKKLGGRKKGSTSLKNTILQAMENAHARGKLGYLEKLARDDPKTFATLAAKVLPTEIAAELTTVAEKVVEVRDYTGRKHAEGSQRSAAEAEEDEKPRIH